VKQIAKAMFVLGGIGDNTVQLGTVRKSQLAAGGEGEQLAGEGSGEPVVVRGEVIAVVAEICVGASVNKMTGTVHFWPESVHYPATPNDGVHLIATLTAEAVTSHAGHVKALQREPKWIDVIVAGGAAGNITVFFQ
jgi:hypothetical protein